MEASNRELKELMLLYGYSKDCSDYILNDDMYDCLFEMCKIDLPSLEGIVIPYTTHKQIIYNSASFLNSLIKIHKIHYLSDEQYKELYLQNSNATIGDFITLFNMSHSEINPFRLPVRFEEEDIINGLLSTRIICVEDEELSYKIFAALNICFNNISLSEKLTDLNSACYVHEIIHTQTSYMKGMIEELSNSELLSIFFELLYAYDSNPNTYHILLTNRICHLLNAFINSQNKTNIFEYTMSIKYMISILKALNLLDKYLNNNNMIKKEILKNIQRVIDAEITLEECLNKLEIFEENSTDCNITRRLILK
jgi:hypothetical protein